MMRGAVLVLVTSCFSKPGLAPGDAPLEDVLPDDMGACTIPANARTGLAFAARRVTWPEGMQLGFGDPLQHVPQPTLLTMTEPTRNLIAGAGDCQNEDQVGVAYYPLFAAAPSTSTNGFTGLALETAVAGAAYVEVVARWSRPFECSGTSSVASGETRWGIIPGGRIVRVDHALPTSVPIDLRTCDAPAQSCGGFDAFYLTSYFSFARDEVDAIATLPALSEVPPPAIGASNSIGLGGCIRDPQGGRLAVRWDQFTGTTTGARFRSTMGSEEQIVLVADMERVMEGSPTPVPLPEVTTTVRTTVLLDRAGAATCQQLQNTAAQHGAQQPLLASDATQTDVEIPSHQTEVFVAGAFASTVTLRSNGGVRLPGFVVSIAMPGTRIATSRDPSRVIWHHDASAGRFYLWFEDALEPAETITLTSGC